MNRTETVVINSVFALFALGIAGIGFLRGLNRWMLHTIDPQTPTFGPYVSAVELDEDLLYEECPCENGTPCIRCMDETIVPHACHE